MQILIQVAALTRTLLPLQPVPTSCLISSVAPRCSLNFNAVVLP